jgi:hypothetical protein
MSIQRVVKSIELTSSSLFTRIAALGGILLATIGPFLLLTNGGRELSLMPWYLWVIMPLMLLLVIAAGILMFRHVSHHAEDISISPDYRGTDKRR